MKVFNNKKQKLSLALDRILSLLFINKKRVNVTCRTILIFDFHLIGDIVLLTALLKALREKYSEAHIILVCGRWGVSVLENNPLIVDRILIFNAPWVIKKYSLESVFSFFSIIRKLKKLNVDLGIEVRGDLRQIFMMSLCKVKRLVGFSFTGGSALLSDDIPDDGFRKHLIEYHKKIADYLNCPVERCIPELWFSQKEKKQIHGIQTKHNGKAIVGIHLGAGNRLRQLPLSTAVETINQIVSSDYHVVLFQGPDDEKLIISVLKEIKDQVEVIKTSLRPYIVRIASCSLILCMDSGCGHLAAAAGVPAIVVFGPQDPDISKPIGDAVSIVAVPDGQVPCRPCDQTGCTHETYNYCMKAVTAQMIIKKISNRLKK